MIGGVLIHADAFDRVADILSPDDFYLERHACVFRAMLVLSDNSRPLDVVSVAERLTQSGDLARVGGLSYLAELNDKIATAANVEHHARIVRDKAILRGLIQTSSQILEQAYSSQGATDEFLDRAEAAIFDISNQSQRSGPMRIDSLIPPTIQRIEQLVESKQAVTGVPSGFEELDRITAGFQPSDLIIVAGRPSMGKTALCLNVAEYASLQANVGVAIFSMEMSKEQLVMRMLCSQAEIDNSRVRTGDLRDRDFKKLALTAGQLGTARIFIDDSPAQSVIELRAKARRLKSDGDVDLGLIIIDYMQLMRGHGEDSREQEISSISRSLKALAKELNIPIIALSQLNRQVEMRQDKRPGLSDLRESGAIEQDADVIAFIYRDDFYHPQESQEQGVAEIIVGKQRNGPTGVARLQFDGQFARFRPLSGRADPGGGFREGNSGSY